MTVVQADEAYSPQSPEASIPSQISTPLMNVSTIEGSRTTHTKTDDATFYTDGSTGIFRQATPSTPTSREMCLSLRAFPPLRRLHEDKKETKHRDVFSQKRGSVAGHLRGMRPTLTSRRTP